MPSNYKTYIGSLRTLSKIIWLAIFEFNDFKTNLRLFCETSLAHPLCPPGHTESTFTAGH